MGVLSGPSDVEAMLDRQLSVLRDKTPRIFPKKIGVTVADALLAITKPLQVEYMPRTDDDRMIFPSLFASRVECSHCSNKLFTKYYRPQSHGCTVPLTDDVVQWCMHSFKWSVTLSTTKSYHNKWPTISYVPFNHNGWDFPFLARGSVEMIVWVMPKNENRIHVRGSGLPRGTMEMTNYILENVTRILEIDMKAVQPSVVHVAYSIGTCTYSRYGKDLYLYPLCEACATLPESPRFTLKVEPV